MVTKWAVVGAMIAVAAVLAIPAWLVMRLINHLLEQRRGQEEAARERRFEAEIAKVRDDIKWGRRQG
jgi:hypothetical protein